MKKIGLVSIGVLLFLAVLAQAFLAGLRYEKLEFLRVVDGDTFWVQNFRDGSEWKVRLWGVDAPDLKQCYFKESTKILENELMGRNMKYEIMGRDDYGRILAKVFIDGKNIEELLVATGAAVAYDAKEVHDDLKPSKEYFESLKKLEERAKSEGLGMWSAECR